MKPFVKILLALLVGGAIAAGLAFYFHGHDSAWRSGPGIGLEFEPLDPSADLQNVRAIVERRFENQRAVVSVDGKRITVWIPYPEPRQAAREELLKQLIELRKVAVSPAKIDVLLQLPPEARADEMKHLAPPDSAMEGPLKELAAAADAVIAAERLAATRPKDSPAAQQAIAEAQNTLRKARIGFFRESLTGDSLIRMLSAADDPSNTQAVKMRKELPALYPAQATEILHVGTARDAWRAAGWGRWNRAGARRRAAARGSPGRSRIPHCRHHGRTVDHRACRRGRRPLEARPSDKAGEGRRGQRHLD